MSALSGEGFEGFAEKPGIKPGEACGNLAVPAAGALQEVGLVDALMAADSILKGNEGSFLERRSLLTAKQWKFLIAVAKEGEVSEPTGSAFLQKYGLGAPSTAARLLNALTEKELLLETKTLEGSTYCVYNVFLSRWLERL